jgi:hypothetical protein
MHMNITTHIGSSLPHLSLFAGHHPIVASATIDYYSNSLNIDYYIHSYIVSTSTPFKF